MNNNQMIYVDPQLSQGEALRWAYFFKELNNNWVITSENPENKNIDTYELLDNSVVLTKYPELKQLLTLDFDKSISFRKGMNSDKWYDFHF